LVVGLILAILGVMLFLNVLSLRELVLATRLHPAISVVFEARDELSHRRAQGIELLVGLFGAAMVTLAARWLRADEPHVRTGT
jgi:hypothetical protein